MYASEVRCRAKARVLGRALASSEATAGETARQQASGSQPQTTRHLTTATRPALHRACSFSARHAD